VMVVGWAMVALVSLLVWGLVRAPWGRVLRAIREDEDAARAVGKNAFAYKLQSLVLGGVIGAFAGMIRLFDSGSVNTISFLPRTTFFIWTVLILGGAATIRGPIAGAIAFWFIIIFSEGLLRQATQDDILPGWLLDPDQVSAVRWIIMGIMLGSLMIWRPQGMFGNREETLIDVFKS
ncbi:MAG: branched-chain amino acid ABC transporter permease, partial [Acidimicrobiia bacterium]|nr:branched-chain amino acid ABC transporter permease [Acidimicrobiia bacterium]